MIAVDTSVVVAAFAPWHEGHAEARRAMGRRPHLPQHCALEVYATLTRLPEPFRAPAATVAEYIRRRFRERYLLPEAADYGALPQRLADLGIVGGATYDALVAVTVAAHGGMLRTFDLRAEPTYRAIGVDYEVVQPG